jgi:thioester reductase-like protein
VTQLYLITAEVETSEYMSERARPRKQVIRLVRASDAEEARNKLEQYYESRSDSYGTSYHVWSIQATETIE